MMAAASIVSVFPSMNVSAASETAKITFAYCHDGAGNTIKYQQTVTHDGRVCGEAGEARTRIYADGEPAFCIQPGVSLHTGNTLRANASDTWNALSGSQMPPPLKFSGDCVRSCHISASFSFHVSSALTKFCTTQLSESTHFTSLLDMAGEPPKPAPCRHSFYMIIRQLPSARNEG